MKRKAVTLQNNQIACRDTFSTMPFAENASVVFTRNIIEFDCIIYKFSDVLQHNYILNSDRNREKQKSIVCNLFEYMAHKTIKLYG